ncbi:MAG: ABC transporter ATP-binding protein [Bacteriovoracaceae bacterium]|nr:ABC transporter ATP-binding protein [Bacteriovoracaceae bacterium]
MLGNAQADLAIKAESLHKDYPGLTAVDHLEFSVPKGVVHGFLGPNGAGKSTTIRMMCGLLRPTSGRILVEGFDPVDSPFEVKSKVGLLPENPPLYKDMTVMEYLRYTAQLHKVINLNAALERVITQTNISQVAPRLIGNLSKGFRQRVGIAQALIHDPSLIILDEPTSGLDPESVVEVRALIKDLKKTKTVLFSSHLLHEVEEICDTITIISQGKLVAHGMLSDVRLKFEGLGHIEVEVKSLSKDQKKKISDLPYVAKVESVETPNQTKIQIFLNTKEEMRAEIVREMIKMNLDLLMIDRKGVELEGIFLALTKHKDLP